MLKNLTRDQKYLLLILTLVNFLNYVDRQVVFPLFHHIKLEFGISDFQLGLLGTAFMLSHSLLSLPLGVIADKYSRKWLITFGLMFWSVVTFASGLVQSFRALLLTRALVGVGEASYAPAATAMISEQLPQDVRARAQGLFNAGMLIGGTLGAIIGGIIAYYFANWRLAFFLVAIPGLVLVWFSTRLKDSQVVLRQGAIPWAVLWKNQAYIWIIISGILVTFATGAYITWGVEFVSRYRQFNLRDTSIILGLTFMVAGVLGIFLGSYFADRLHRTIAWGRSFVVAVSLMVAAPIMYWGIHITSPQGGWLLMSLFFVGVMLMSFYFGPVTAVIHDVLPERLHATAFAAYLLIVHLLGDTAAPAVIGRISDRTDLRAALEWSTLFVFLSGLTFLMVCYYVERQHKQTN